ncbi:uncharacterized protein [Henckelia pumila]|uniref:uncharacterized protein n=1 Tax=Henckelia pumila TaxID=405737 RepID=UPI003C6DBD05
MANFHSRSNSFPSKSHPVMDEIQDHLRRLKASEATSITAKSVNSDLVSLVDLHEGVQNLIQIPSIQQVLSHEQCGTWINEILEGSLSLVDLCGFSRDVCCSMKEYIQELESSIRRNRDKTATETDIKSYLVSRKKINKMISMKYVKNLKSFDQNSTVSVENDNNLQAIVMVMKHAAAISFSVLNSVPLFLSGANGRSKSRNWSLLSKFTLNHVYPETDRDCGSKDLFDLHVGASMKFMDKVIVQNILKKLKESEMAIHELEDGLESLFRSLVKTRVSLLNILSDH